jgi:2-polyprenyl-3-methyl-5-hydroxy-6-metoxy-1,4-benzoquinol methylase
VDRYEYVKQRCRDLRVLDLGAYDETEVGTVQHKGWRWLHAEIASTAQEVLGVDASPQLRDTGGVDTDCGTRIIYGRVEELDEIVKQFRPDIVVAGELIEHTQDTLGWLSALSLSSPGTPILATTPNTTSLINMLLTLLNRENAHPDHLHVYSYRTLATLASRVPLGSFTLRPYFYDPHLFYDKVPRVMAPVVTATNTVFLRPMQWLFPLTSFGWILEGTLGGE